MSTSTNNTLRRTLLPLAVGLMLAAGTVAAAEPTGVAAEVMAAAQAQWAAENDNKPASQSMSSIADDYTEFNGIVPTLVEGKAMAAKFYTASLQSGDKTLVSEMINPHVQVYGDAAILTYNYAGMTKDGDGKMHNNAAKSTRVYVKQGGNWKLVHANFAPVVPAAP
jgi:ketosteroid isomerase-like protein